MTIKCKVRLPFGIYRQFHKDDVGEFTNEEYAKYKALLEPVNALDTKPNKDFGGKGKKKGQ